MTETAEETLEMKELVESIHQLPASDLAIVQRIVDALAGQANRTRELEFDEEELRPEVAQQLREAMASEGPFTDHEDFRRELGL